ncbi:MAG: hypothetical protein WDN69_23725 [Aliidongia sp.]
MLVEAAGEPYRRRTIEMIYETEGAGEDQPSIARSPEIMHGLGNIIQNAVQFATERGRGHDHLGQDRIFGRSRGLMGLVFQHWFYRGLGEPYLSGRGDEAEHMGARVFSSRKPCCAVPGATLVFANAPDGGAVVRGSWRRRTRNAEGGLAAGPLKFEDSVST